MAISKVIIPTTANGDYDFLAFSFNGLHSWDDFKIIRISDGDRYNTELGPQSQDKTAENPGGDGMYYFNTNHKQKVFNINFAFEEIDDVTVRNIKRWLSSKELGDLWFEEEPYKIYSAKVTGQPTLKYIPFDKDLEDGTTKRIYRGEGNVQFTAFWPYAHTPDKICERTTDANGLTEAESEKGNGNDFDSYGDGTGAGAWGFRNRTEWKIASGLTSSTGACLGENPGDLPAPFLYTHPDSLGDDESSDNTYYKIKIGDTSGSGSTQIFTGAEVIIEIPAGRVYNELSWDSKTGIVSAKVGSTDTPAPIATIGNTCYAIPSDGINTIQFLSVTKNESGDFIESPLNTIGNYKITISYDDSGKETERVWQKYTTNATGEVVWQDITSNAPTLKYHYWYY